MGVERVPSAVPKWLLSVAPGSCTIGLITGRGIATLGGKTKPPGIGTGRIFTR